uniref:Uncharacterized protein n=1 Tax=Prorocentrum micans TaxID=2945 RepID=A0A7S2T9F7_PROMC|mmetsp:Transcript_10225/g.7810  ORF Transcript_10225/g.7810 Transcript_10225/m.7810 type:complete len:107 (+) Transcript_10225:1-321(+)
MPLRSVSLTSSVAILAQVLPRLTEKASPETASGCTRLPGRYSRARGQLLFLPVDTWPWASASAVRHPKRRRRKGACSQHCRPPPSGGARSARKKKKKKKKNCHAVP